MSRVGQKIARVVRKSLYLSGMEGLLYNRKKEVDVIVGYHNVVDEIANQYNYRCISRDDFRRHVTYFKRNFDVISLGEMLDKPNPGVRRLVITLDDGLINNFNHAAVVLRRLRVPATFFVCAAGLDGEEVLWTDRLSILLFHTAGPLRFDGANFDKTSTGSFVDAQGQRLEHVLKHSPGPVRKAFCDMLEKDLDFNPLLGADPNFWELMQVDHIRALAKNPLFEIGSHGLRHELFTTLDDEQLSTELNHSKSLLESAAQTSITSLSFPDGDFDARVVAAAQRAGYQRLIGVEVPDKNSDVRSRLGMFHDRSWIEQLHALRRRI